MTGPAALVLAQEAEGAELWWLVAATSLRWLALLWPSSSELSG